ncbi:DNA helicase II, UvrD [Chlamydia abortus]|uniref:DNA 3'-5' helicase n=1 Tax=Chlamydia abortus (strain DSM 27085 / S26/3) TaxID=218497 RepID=Q5L4Q3_CHLAB|nr:UvrD-helicase domain-containing protein [Chlamydia abortus]ASD31052.1 ATP-dependent DNA helicase [Chlamydia abortus]AUS60438.1 ATP-dependent DNA helicase UvrD/PcrA [Chlamydia abortus]QRR31696.1 UvrD-helicase domain-containing protein [Chlamydia abortus]CAH64393.1 DNA helicase II, UvrD [Chlamydia abortus S26/3]CED80997.1 DNA helicase II, UvrD [Chlamydia abortus]
MLTSELNEAQIAAVTSPLSPILVLAGAGAGKTRVVTCRILHLINEGIAPKEILAVTFTNKAAKELKERILHLCPQAHGSDIPMVCTFHSLGVFILRRSIQALNRENNFIIYDQSDTDKLLKQCLQKFNLKKTLSSSIQYHISQAKNRLLSPEDLDPEEYIDPVVSIYKEYQQRLHEANALDFDDLLFLTVRLFQEFPEVRKEYSELWKALLIDEYQDTNHAQYKMAQTIAGKHQNIFAVGDPDQSIYSWRGANIHNILNFEKDYPRALVLRLEDNYRSYGNILNAANALIQNNASRLKKDLRSVKGPGEKIRVFLGKTDKEEAEFVADEISRLHRRSQIPLSDICIFYRTNFQSRTFEDALLRRRIPYEILGGLSFYKRKEIQDILAFLRMFTAKSDVVAFDRTVNLPKRGLGPSTISSLIEYALTNNLPILEACNNVLQTQEVKLSKKQQEGLREYLSIFQQLEHAYATLPLNEFVVATIRITGYFQVLKEDPDTFEDRKSNLDELASKTFEWEQQNTDGTLENFLDDLALKSSTDDTELIADRVNLMTIHNGKGLEFRIAFVVGLEENLFPHANSKSSYENLEEERRLCYVGITRAQDLLYLTAAQTRFLWGTVRVMKPSRFLKEIPRDYLIQVH